MNTLRCESCNDLKQLRSDGYCQDCHRENTLHDLQITAVEVATIGLILGVIALIARVTGTSPVPYVIGCFYSAVGQWAIGVYVPRAFDGPGHGMLLRGLIQGFCWPVVLVYRLIRGRQ